MKEDKLDKDIAASLKKKLAEASVPYEMGAWEGFQKKRRQRHLRDISYWAAGIAASLLLLVIGLNSVDLTENQNNLPTELKLADEAKDLPSSEPETLPTPDTQELDVINENLAEAKSILPDTYDESSVNIKLKSNQYPPEKSEVNTLLTDTANGKKGADGKVEVATEAPLAPQVNKEEVRNTVGTLQPPLIATTEEVGKKSEEKSAEEQLGSLPKVEESTKLETNQNLIAESDFPEIPAQKTTLGLGMGLSPGFGAMQNDNQMATAQTIGLGVLLDIKLPGKLTLGSGLGLNYLSQNTEQQSTVMAFGNTYPQTEKLEVRQMQVEVPVFVKYPLTRNNAISVQAGFSNFYAINESGSQENTFDRQVASYSTNADGLSSVTLSKQAVNNSSELESTGSKFYPFATLNFGLNLRVLETKGANYVIMPFYNYQLKQVSGYGETFGLFGASFKMNFGGGDK